jgi:hypothetical protein
MRRMPRGLDESTRRPTVRLTRRSWARDDGCRGRSLLLRQQGAAWPRCREEHPVSCPSRCRSWLMLIANEALAHSATAHSDRSD